MEKKAEDIAIIGMSCRFPKAPDLNAYWKLCWEGIDAITEVPVDRWDLKEFYDPDPKALGKTYSRWGGFLTNLDSFDADFFGISPREAQHVDPRQRLILELSWEALENAGISPQRLESSKTGVFIATLTDDYTRYVFSDRHKVEAYSGSGTAHSVIANRLSYFYNFHGPSLTLDTACSGSLLAIHLAAQSLRQGESDLTLVGGVNLLLTPDSTLFFSRAGALSKSGRCRAFDKKADGFVRSDGAGIIILKRLADAIQNNDRIYAVIRGSAVNQDGRTNGIMAPSRKAQESVLIKAYENSAVLPSQVQYIEAHGTGTPLGDATEIRALASVLQHDRSHQNRCLIGSVKTNIGHTEAAAGIAGIIKTALAIYYRQLPKSLHFSTPSRAINYDDLPFKIATLSGDWPDATKPLIAGVSAFGFGGTNAHVVLSDLFDGKLKPPQNKKISFPAPLFLAAKNKNALQEMARQYCSLLQENNIALDTLLIAANVKKSTLKWRLAVKVNDGKQAREALNYYVEGKACDDLVTGINYHEKNKLAFIYSCEGSHWKEIAFALLPYPIFANALTICDKLAKKSVNFSIIEKLHAKENLSRDEDYYLIIFSIQLALTTLLKAMDIQPDLAVGEGLAEIVALFCMGEITLEKAFDRAVHQRLESYFAESNSEETLEKMIDVSHFLELGGQSKLIALIKNSDRERFKSITTIQLFSADKDFKSALLNVCMKLYVNGFAVNYFMQECGFVCELPNYPWQRERYWIEKSSARDQNEHPLLGKHIALANSATHIWHNKLTVNPEHFLSDHKWLNQCLFPGAGFVEMALAAAKTLGFSNQAISLSDVNFVSKLLLKNDSLTELQVVATKNNQEDFKIEIYSKNIDSIDNEFNLHATASLNKIQSVTSQKRNINDLLARCPRVISAAEHYQKMSQLGFDYGASFRGVSIIYQGDNESLAKIKSSKSSSHFQLHPTLLDALFQLAATLVPDNDQMGIPVGLDKITLFKEINLAAWGYAYRSHSQRQSNSFFANLELFDETGDMIAQIENLEIRSHKKIVSSQSTLSEKEKWLYYLSWETVSQKISTAPQNNSIVTWIIFGGGNGLSSFCSNLWQANKCRVIQVTADNQFQELEPGAKYSVNPSCVNDYVKVLDCISDDNLNAPIGIVSLWALEQPKDSITNVEKITENSLALIQGLLCRDLNLKLFLITRGAQAIQSSSVDFNGISQATVWGLGRSVMQEEYPRLQGLLLDLDPNQPTLEEDAKIIVNELAYSTPDEQIAYRNGNRYRAELKRQNDLLHIPFKSSGAVLITGGAGALGKELTKWLCLQGVKNIILMNRHPEKSLSFINSLKNEYDLTIEVAAVDIADFAALKKYIINRNASALPKITSIFHLAAVLKDAQLPVATADDVKTIFSAKVRGLLNLWQIFSDQALEHFILFSSLAALLPGTGQGLYAAANAYLDAFSYYLRNKGIPALSIQWGPWKAGLMTLSGKEDFLAIRGLKSIAIEDGLDLLSKIIPIKNPTIMVGDIDWSVLKKFRLHLPLMIQKLIEGKAKRVEATSLFSIMSDQEREKQIRSHIEEMLTIILQIQSSKIDANQSLISLGLDSMMALELKNRLEQLLNLRVTPSEILNGLTLNNLVKKAIAHLKNAHATNIEEENFITALSEIETMSEMDVQNELGRNYE